MPDNTVTRDRSQRRNRTAMFLAIAGGAFDGLPAPMILHITDDGTAFSLRLDSIEAVNEWVTYLRFPEPVLSTDTVESDGRRWHRYQSSNHGWLGTTLADIWCPVYVNPVAIPGADREAVAA